MVIPKYYKKQHQLLGVLLDKSNENKKIDSYAATEIALTEEETSHKMEISIAELRQLVQSINIQMKERVFL